MAKKKSYQEVKEHIELKNAELLSEEYINSITPLIIKCSCGEIFERKFKTIQKSKICMCDKCTKNHVINEHIISYEEVVDKVEKRKYKILVSKDDYKGINYKYDFLCPQGHKRNMWLSDFLKGHECKICATKKVMDGLRLNYEDVKKYIESFNYRLISTEYIDNDKKLKIICDKGHEFEMSYHNFKDNHRCPICNVIRRSEKQTIPFDKRKEFVESFGYKILIDKNEYINGNEKILLECPNGHKFNMSMHDFKIGNRCPYCYESKGEKEISRILDELKIDYVYNMGYFKDLKCNKSPLRPDFIIEDKKIWIEYDGIQHYQYGKFNGDLLDLMNIKYRDKLKDDYAIKNGWKLIRIPYWDFENIEKILRELNL